MFLYKRILFCLLAFTLLHVETSAQNFGNALRPPGRSNGAGTSTDSLQKRDQNADSITLFYKLSVSYTHLTLPTILRV